MPRKAAQNQSVKEGRRAQMGSPMLHVEGPLTFLVPCPMVLPHDIGQRICLGRHQACATENAD